MGAALAAADALHAPEDAFLRVVAELRHRIQNVLADPGALPDRKPVELGQHPEAVLLGGPMQPRRRDVLEDHPKHLVPPSVRAGDRRQRQ
jgi:hypothetical protein